jgi:hypothetical protein
MSNPVALVIPTEGRNLLFAGSIVNGGNKQIPPRSE